MKKITTILAILFAPTISFASDIIVHLDGSGYSCEYKGSNPYVTGGQFFAYSAGITMQLEIDSRNGANCSKLKALNLYIQEDDSSWINFSKAKTLEEQFSKGPSVFLSSHLEYVQKTIPHNFSEREIENDIVYLSFKTLNEYKSLNAFLNDKI